MTIENLDFGRGNGRNFDHLTMFFLKFWPWSWSKFFDNMTMTSPPPNHFVKNLQLMKTCKLRGLFLPALAYLITKIFISKYVSNKKYPTNFIKPANHNTSIAKELYDFNTVHKIEVLLFLLSAPHGSIKVRCKFF